MLRPLLALITRQYYPVICSLFPDKYVLTPPTGELRNKDIQEETHQVMHNLKAILQKAEMGFANVVKTTIFLTDMHQFGQVNEVYGKYFDSDFPARETVQVSALPKFVNVEISMIAVK